MFWHKRRLGQGLWPIWETHHETLSSEKVVLLYLKIYLYLFIYSYVLSDPRDTQSPQISQKQDGRNIYIILKTMCSPDYHHNGFMATHALGHMTYSTVHLVPKCMNIYIYIYMYIYIYILLYICIYIYIYFYFAIF